MWKQRRRRPYRAELDEDTRQRTLRFYLDQWRDYVGAPMLPALYGVWAAWIGASHLAVFLERRPALGESLRRYAAGLMSELEQSAACNALHRTEKRFAKWLLRAHDRIDGDVLLLTQDYLANMLGTQRTTVNEAARELQDQGAIEYMRGRILIVNRGLLERAACECYGAQAGLLDNVLTMKPLGQ